jgi:hypothetical protein
MTSAHLEHEEQQREPHDGLEDGELDDELLRPLAVHGQHHGHADDERVGERGEGEAGDGPALAQEPRPHGDDGHDHSLGDDVGGHGAVVHLERVRVQRELEGEEGQREEGHQPVHGVALIAREDAPPPHRAVAKEQREVERHRRCRNLVNTSLHPIISYFPNTISHSL